MTVILISFFFFFNDTATTEIYTLSLHDALPISTFDLQRINTMHITTVGVSQRARKLSKGRKLVMLLASILIMILSLLSMDASTPAQAATTGVIFQTTFNTDAIGLYTIAEMKLDFHAPWEDGVTEGLVSVVNNPAGGTGKVLKVHYPVGRTSYGVIIPVPLNAQYDALYLSYDVYFPSDFDFVKE